MCLRFVTSCGPCSLSRPADSNNKDYKKRPAAWIVQALGTEASRGLVVSCATSIKTSKPKCETRSEKKCWWWCCLRRRGVGGGVAYDDVDGGGGGRWCWWWCCCLRRRSSGRHYPPPPATPPHPPTLDPETLKLCQSPKP